MRQMTEEMASQTLSGLLRTWRRHQRGEWKWLLLALCTVVLLAILIHTSDLMHREARVRILELFPADSNTGGFAWIRIQAGQNSTLQIFPTEQTTLLARLHYYERRVMDSYLRVKLALAASSGTLALPTGPPLVDVGTLQNLRSFQPLLTVREKARLLTAFEVFSTACQVAGLTYFLLDNSAIGSVRHHGIIPWTDFSITVGMHKEDQTRALHVLDNLSGMSLFWPNPYEWSLRLQDVRPEPPDLVRMTFVNINFYRQNSTHIWGETWGGKRTFTAPRERVFPLAMRPFEGWLVPAPCDVTSVVEERGLGQCRVMEEDKWEMEWRDAGLVPCSVLKQVFPFVTRRVTPMSRSVTEQLYVNGTSLYSIDVQTGCTDSENSTQTI